MSSEKISLYSAFKDSGDIRVLIDLIERYEYTDEEASKVINIYEPYENNRIPEVEHIEVLLSYFPKSKISENTMNAIKSSFPGSIEHITKLQNRKQEK